MKLNEIKRPCKLFFIKSSINLEKYGFFEGVEIKVLKVLKDAVIVRVASSCYSLNESLAKCVEVKVYD